MAPGIFNLETAPATPAVQGFCGASPEAASAFLSVLDGYLGSQDPLEPEPPAEPDGMGQGVPFGLVLPCTITVDLPRAMQIEEPPARVEMAAPVEMPAPVQMPAPPQVAPAGMAPREPETGSAHTVQAVLIDGVVPPAVPTAAAPVVAPPTAEKGEFAVPVPTEDKVVADDRPAHSPNGNRAQAGRTKQDRELADVSEWDMPVPAAPASALLSGDIEPAGPPEDALPEAGPPEIPEGGREPEIPLTVISGPSLVPIPEGRGRTAENEVSPSGCQDRPASRTAAAEPSPADVGPRALPGITAGEMEPRAAAHPLAFAVRVAEQNPAPRADHIGDALLPEGIPVETAPVESTLPDAGAPLKAEAASRHPDAPSEAKRPEPAPSAARPVAGSNAPERPDAAAPAPPRVAPAAETGRQETGGQDTSSPWRGSRGEEKPRSAAPATVPATSPEPARTDRQASTAKPEPLAETRLEPEPPPRPAAPVRSMTLRLDGQDQKIDIRLAERAGEIRVAVHAPEGELRSRLQDQLPDLVRGLDRQGFSAETWRPAETSSRSHDGDRGAQDAPSGGGHGGAHQDGRGRQKHPQPGWLEEIGGLEAEPERSSTPWQLPA